MELGRRVLPPLAAQAHAVDEDAASPSWMNAHQRAAAKNPAPSWAEQGDWTDYDWQRGIYGCALENLGQYAELEQLRKDHGDVVERQAARQAGLTLATLPAEARLIARKSASRQWQR